MNWTTQYNELKEEKDALNTEWNLKWNNLNAEWEAKYKAMEANPPGMEEKDTIILNWTTQYNELKEEKDALNTEWTLKWNNLNSDWESKYNAIAENPPGMEEKDTIILNWTNKYNELKDEKDALNNEWNLKWNNFNAEWESKYNNLAENPPGIEEKDTIILNWTNKYNELKDEKDALNNEWNLKWNNFNSEWESKYNALAENPPGMEEKDTIILNWTTQYNELKEEKDALNNEWNLKWTNLNADWEAKYKAIAENPPGMEEKDTIILNWTNKYNALADEKEALNNEWNLKWGNLNADWGEKCRVLEEKLAAKPKEVEVIKEVPVEVVKEVEVIKEVPVEVVKEVEVIKEVPVEVVKEVEVVKVKEVVKEVEVPVEIIKEVEVIKEVPIEIVKEVEVVKQMDFNSLKEMMMKMQTVQSKQVVSETKRAVSAKEDLTKIEGIGPKIQELLYKAGIYSYADLGKASKKTLSGILDAAGSRYQMHDPSTWAKQAKMAASGKWEALLKWQDELNGGQGAKKATKKVAKKAAVKKAIKKDNLTKIEGIGPKIASLLNDAGIHTFAELSKASNKKLKAILEAAGSRFRMHDPGSWPKQSKLAAAGKWDALKKLQDELDGGR